MISTEYIELPTDSKEKLSKNLQEVETFLARKFPKFTIYLSLLALFVIVVLISQYEEYAWSVLLKVATAFPLTMIIISLISYFHKRGYAKQVKAYYHNIVRQGTYEALRVQPHTCENYKDALDEYFLFSVNDDTTLLLRINDFIVDRKSFPCDNFVVPPWQLSDIMGYKIICEGKPMPYTRNRSIERLIPALMSHPKGEVMITVKPKA